MNIYLLKAWLKATTPIRNSNHIKTNATLTNISNFMSRSRVLLTKTPNRSLTDKTTCDIDVKYKPAALKRNATSQSLLFAQALHLLRMQTTIATNIVKLRLTALMGVQHLCAVLFQIN